MSPTFSDATCENASRGRGRRLANLLSTALIDDRMCFGLAVRRNDGASAGPGAGPLPVARTWAPECEACGHSGAEDTGISERQQAAPSGRR